ncbi:hypothetical protein PRUPE_3G176500 [Prunus persica]|uniref:Cytochrome b561 domain-containing protein n=1 Tax=Prunus persica TaxID=3760 RepID=A0A251Q2V7_PRUPE|nr:hypothetical protein PRUPE_3G176500 [Prunus persica]
MQFLQKLGFFCIHASVLLLLVSPLVSSSQEHTKGASSHKDNNIHEQMSHKLLFEITLHGFLLWASMGFLMPLGILAIRMSHREECGRRLRILFYVHGLSELFSVLLATAGAVMSFRNFNNSFNNKHQRVGVGLYGLIWLQALIGFVRPQRVEGLGGRRKGENDFNYEQTTSFFNALQGIQGKKRMVFCALDTWNCSFPAWDPQHLYRFTSLP